MKAIAAISVGAQVVGLACIAFMLFEFYASIDKLIEIAAGDKAVLKRLVLETVASYGPYIGIGIIGAISTWLLILKGRYRTAWYLKTTRVLAWMWMAFIPVGTALGVLVLSARSAAIESRKAP